jgi:large subunit ribosomal protein L18
VRVHFKTKHCRVQIKKLAKKLGTLVAELAKKQNITTVVFDRGHNKFHGVLAELANAARESGLQF